MSRYLLFFLFFVEFCLAGLLAAALTHDENMQLVLAWFIWLGASFATYQVWVVRDELKAAD